MILHLLIEDKKIIFGDWEIKNRVQDLSDRLLEAESLSDFGKCNIHLKGKLIDTYLVGNKSSSKQNNRYYQIEDALRVYDTNKFLIPPDVLFELKQYKSSVENTFNYLSGIDFSTEVIMTCEHTVMNKQNKCKFLSMEPLMDKNNVKGNDTAIEKVSCFIDKNVENIIKQSEECGRDSLEMHKSIPANDIDHSSPENSESRHHLWQRRDSFSSCSSDSAVYCSSKHTLLKSLSAVSKETSLWECGLNETTGQNTKRERHSSSSSLISIVSDVSCKDSSKHTAVSSNDLNCTLTLQETMVLRENTESKGPVPSLVDTLKDKSSTKFYSNIKSHSVASKDLEVAYDHKYSTPQQLLSLQQLSLHNLRKNIKYKITCSHDECKEHSHITLHRCAQTVKLTNPESQEKSLELQKISCRVSDIYPLKKPKRKSEIDQLYDALKEIPWARKFSPENMLLQNDVRRYSSRISGYYKLLQNKSSSKGAIPSASLYKRALPTRHVQKRDQVKKIKIPVKKAPQKINISRKSQNSDYFFKNASECINFNNSNCYSPKKYNSKTEFLKNCNSNFPSSQDLPQTSVQNRQNISEKQILKKYFQNKPIVKLKPSLKPVYNTKKETYNIDGKLALVKEHTQRTVNDKNGALFRETYKVDDLLQDDLPPPVLYPECSTSNHLIESEKDTTLYYSKSDYTFNRHAGSGIWTSSQGFYVFSEKEQEKTCDSITLVSSKQKQTVASGVIGENKRSLQWNNFSESPPVLDRKIKSSSLDGSNQVNQLVKFRSIVGRCYTAPIKKLKFEEEVLGSKSAYHGFTFHYKGITVRKNENYTQVVLKLSNNKNIFLTVEAMTELKETLLSAVNDPNCQMLILNGSGNTFCSGLDLRPLIGPRKREAADEMAVAVKELVEALASFHKPLVAAVNGCAMGLGVTLLTYSDVVLASDSATFQTPYAQLGYMPEGAGTLTLPQVIGATLATDMFLRGHKLTAHQAQSHGLVSEVLDDGHLFEQVLPRVQALADHPTHIMEATKTMMRWHLWDKLQVALENEAQILPKQWLSPTCQQAITEALESGILID